MIRGLSVILALRGAAAEPCPSRLFVLEFVFFSSGQGRQNGEVEGLGIGRAMQQ